MRARSVLPLAVIPVLLASLAACSPTPAPAPTVTVTVTPKPAPKPSASVDPNAPQGQCADDALKIAVDADPGGAGAGSVFFDVVFTNTGSTACRLAGYPGVSVVDAKGNQLGQPAGRNGSDPVVRDLAPGASVFAALQKVDIGTDGGPLDGCTVVQGTGWSVYAPHSFTRVIVSSSQPVPACSPGPVFMNLTAPVAPGTHP